MSAKIELNIVAAAMKDAGVPADKLREVLEALNAELAASASEPKEPAPKKQFVILLSDATGLIRQRMDTGNLVGWVLQIPEDASPHSVTDRIFKGAYDFNASKRGRLLPVKSVGEALESAGAKYFRESELWVKTKLPVGIVVTDNVLPRDEFKIERVDRRTKQGELEPFQKICRDHGATVEIRAGGNVVKIDGNGVQKG